MHHPTCKANGDEGESATYELTVTNGAHKVASMQMSLYDMSSLRDSLNYPQSGVDQQKMRKKLELFKL